MQKPEKSKNNVGRLSSAVRYSWQGLKAGWAHEAAIKQEVYTLILAVVLAFAFPFTGFERLLLIGCLVLAIAIELLNSGLEALVDLVSPDYHELAGRAKDLGSAAVFVVLLWCAAVWLTIAAPKIYAFFTV